MFSEGETHRVSGGNSFPGLPPWKEDLHDTPTVLRSVSFVSRNLYQGFVVIVHPDDYGFGSPGSIRIEVGSYSILPVVDRGN